MKTAFRAGDVVVCLLDPRPRQPFVVDFQWSNLRGTAVAIAGTKEHDIAFLADPTEEIEREAYLDCWFVNHIKEKHELRHNSSATAQAPPTLGETLTGGAEAGIAANNSSLA